jgi:Mg-chelatase subunit ChlD
MSDLLKLTSMCNRASVPVIDQPQLIYVLIELVPGKAISSVRLPLNFTLVLDQSGSMAGEKLRTMKEAVKHIIDQLGVEDILSIVTFQSRTEILAPAQPARDKEALKQAVNKIRDGGGTNVAPALQAALRLVSQSLSPERVSRIILLTDGEATDREEAAAYRSSVWVLDRNGRKISFSIWRTAASRLRPDRIWGWRTISPSLVMPRGSLVRFTNPCKWSPRM